MVFLNGLPMAVIELKDPTDTAGGSRRRRSTSSGATRQTAPDLFVPNLLLVASDGLLTRVGTITSGPQTLHAVATLRTTAAASRRWRR